MNLRIKELMTQASSWVEVNLDFGTDSVYQLDAEKFAALIAKECACICLEIGAKCGGLLGDGALATDCANQIKEDFDVK